MLDALFLREWGQDRLLEVVLFLEDRQDLLGRSSFRNPKNKSRSRTFRKSDMCNSWMLSWICWQRGSCAYYAWVPASTRTWTFIMLIYSIDSDLFIESDESMKRLWGNYPILAARIDTIPCQLFLGNPSQQAAYLGTGITPTPLLESLERISTASELTRVIKQGNLALNKQMKQSQRQGETEDSLHLHAPWCSQQRC